MLLSCSRCQNEFIGRKSPEASVVICSKCGPLQTSEPRKSKLGLHPALEKRLSTRYMDLRGHHRHYQDLNAETKHGTTVGLRHSDGSFMPKIPGYDISFQIGKGAMGSVFRAREVRTGQEVAIKVLAHELAVRGDLVARFERESFALKALKNPNIVTILASGQIEETHYFAMEFLDGITLRTRMSRGSVSLKEAVFITEQMLNGLTTAHQAGIIHRDLKPENVLLEYADRDFNALPKRVVLVDFGLVGIGGLMFDPHPNLTRSKVTMGTVNYMAPEQHVDAKRVDQRSDLYSAGVILFEMITGELPLGRYAMPSERGMDVSQELEQVLIKALSRTLEGRYQTADQFQKDLLDILARNNFTETAVIKPVKSSFKDRIKALLASSPFPIRFALLFFVAALFFGLGIKFALPKAPKEMPTAINSKK